MLRCHPRRHPRFHHGRDLQKICGNNRSLLTAFQLSRGCPPSCRRSAKQHTRHSSIDSRRGESLGDRRRVELAPGLRLSPCSAMIRHMKHGPYSGILESESLRHITQSISWGFCDCLHFAFSKLLGRLVWRGQTRHSWYEYGVPWHRMTSSARLYSYSCFMET